MNHKDPEKILNDAMNYVLQEDNALPRYPGLLLPIDEKQSIAYMHAVEILETAYDELTGWREYGND